MSEARARKLENRIDALERRVATLERRVGLIDKPIRQVGSSGGKGETSVILRKLEEKVLGTEFFADPRTVGDARSELKKQTGILFTSRKVSQALGLLHDRGKLDRVGSTGNYQYFRRN
ncbi:MAG TPA: hypothetical protein VFE98_04425 [Candidatus Bathyarchaeia archaeon]|nr:hypothetical protein [Candidatus Bathyarchaeia archaeon]